MKKNECIICMSLFFLTNTLNTWKVLISRNIFSKEDLKAGTQLELFHNFVWNRLNNVSIADMSAKAFSPPPPNMPICVTDPPLNKTCIS